MKTTILAVLASAVAASGSITILNNCRSGTAYQIDAQGITGAPGWINPGAMAVELLSGAPGQAIKFSPTGDFLHPISFDYTVNRADGRVYYDVSDAAGHPLDVFVTPSSLQCQLVACPSDFPLSVCDQPRTCSPDGDYTVELCTKSEETLAAERLRQMAKLASRSR